MASRLGIGAGIGIPFRNIASGGGKPYLSPEVKEALKAVVIAYGKTNNDSDRAIVKNLVDPDNPFVISNAAFKLNSGFGKYEADFTNWVAETGTKLTSDKITNSNPTKNWIAYRLSGVEFKEMHIRILGIPDNGVLCFQRPAADGGPIKMFNGDNNIPAFTSTGICGFFIYNLTGLGWSNLVIEQIPSFEGAFVTDGIDDTIISTKTLAEMGITDEVTVVSMIHQISLNPTYNNGFTNYIENLDKSTYVRNNIYKAGKTGIYGYSASLTSRTYSDINNILGDKKDYGTEIVNRQNTLDRTKFSVVGRASSIREVSSIAWYWTIIANKVLTTDQINQVIAYFNLDRTLKPDILCNTIKQGITNENHAEFGDKLIDYSGNGRDIQLNNIAWDGDSGIGKYNYPNWKVNVTQGNKYARIVYYDSINGTYSANFKGITDLYKSYGLSIEIRVNRANTIDFHSIKEDGIYTITPPDDTTSMDIRFGGEDVYNASCNITITQIPSHAGAFCLDGVNDFGKVTGMPVYKDYTFISKYQRLSYREAIETEGGAVIASKSYSRNQGAFIFNGVRSDYAHDCYSFGLPSSNNLINDKNLEVYYQTKYTNQGKSISSGTAADSDILWLGTVRDNDNRFINAAIYSLMSFPYSMSEFLIERQLKKHKLGTLYPDMVEFRPVIKKDDRIKSIKYYIDGKIANIGQYYPIGSGLGIAVETVQPYMVKSLKVNGVNTIPNADYKGFNARLDSKSPQKITMDIQVDTNLIQWNPIITSTAELTTAPTFAIRGTSTLLKAGDWIPKNSEIWVIVTMNNLIDELRKFSFNGTFIHIPSSSYNPDTGKYGFPFVIDNESPQNINLTIDEYIRYEDIVQPYPILLGLRDENDNEVSWGDKLRVGSTATFTRGLKDSDLLYGMYKIDSIWLNNENMIVVADGRPLGIEKKMEFRSAKEWLLDNNEPKCILSPRLLRIPNSSYKILGHIPDISGHGNHGKINNSAYAGASGANGYLQNFSGWTKASGVSSTDSVISSSNNLVAANGWIAYVTSGTVVPTFKVEISGIPINGNLRFEGSGQTLVNGVNTIQGLTTTKISGFYISNGYDNDWSNLRIEQVGEYEGAYCLDGVNDFVTIPTLSSGGKQVLMKVNWNTINSIIYDQRGSGGFAIYCSDYNNPSGSIIPAYRGRNAAGTTYIDGIRNEYIIASQLRNVTHNIVEILDTSYAAGNINPIIGKSHMNSNYGNLALYDFMLFDNISTDDKIKELNEYVGVEAKVELPPYYWDTYGKTNSDEDKATIQQRGIAVGDYDLTNTNFAYDKMSGFGGYEFAKFDNTLDWYNTEGNDSVEVVSRNGYSITLKRLTGLYFWYFQNSKVRGLISNDIPFKINSNKNISVIWDVHGLSISEGKDKSVRVQELVLNPNEDNYTNLKTLNEEELAQIDISTNSLYYLLWFDLSTLAVNEEVTIEMLPLYPNGLVYDGITDYSKNANIPALDDFTAIIKREWLKKTGLSFNKRK